MRYVDIAQLQLPPGWQSRASSALDALRTAVSAAETAARAAGKSAADVSMARKKVVTDFLDRRSSKAIWGDLKDNLKHLSADKCWYSESRNPTSDKEVDHFRPKNRIAEDPTHEGYWWLAFDHRNYRLSSQWCNQHRNDIVNSTSGGKADHFPLLPGSFRAQKETDDCDREEVELLDPIDPEDWKLLTFRPDGYPTPSFATGTVENKRAEASIRVYHLDCKGLVDERRPLAGRVQRLIQSMETLRPRITDPLLRMQYKEQQKELLRAIRRDADYSAAALAYARAEVYKLSGGTQVKRDWLEEILNSNP